MDTSDPAPVPGAPAATAEIAGERALLVADYHAGIEAGLRVERGVELESHAAARRARLCSLVDRSGADRVVVLGDLGHQVGRSDGAEAEEIDDLVESLSVPLALVLGNHDGGVAARHPSVEVREATGWLAGDLGLLHGHTWPAVDLLDAETICLGHEHPRVALTDPVGGRRVERAWLRGRLDRSVLAAHHGRDDTGTVGVVLLPAFNDRSGGTVINEGEDDFLSPFLPSALACAEAYLLDGTRLGDYRRA